MVNRFSRLKAPKIARFKPIIHSVLRRENRVAEDPLLAGIPPHCHAISASQQSYEKSSLTFIRCIEYS